LPRIPILVWWVVTAALLVLTMMGIERKITWYLAVDQYGYLAFAHDLARGHVFHHWAPLDALKSGMPERMDVLVQTYVYDHGKLYCRYAPGFPIILAGWLTLFGDDGAHYLNGTIFLVILVLLIAFQRRVVHSRWRATAGVALVVLFPTYVHLWALTLTRDLSTHLAGLLGLFLLLPKNARRLSGRDVAASGLALGFAATIRPDAVLYLVPAGCLAIARWYRERASRGTVLRGLAVGALGVTLGLAPSLGYYWAATGSPFRPTQGMEIEQFLTSGPPTPSSTPAPQPRVGFPSGAWRGGTAGPVQGGGLRLQHFWMTFPGIIALLRDAYGDVFLLMAVAGAIIALIRRRVFLVLATVPYCVLAIVFFSFWGRPDTRYLVGPYLLLPILIVEGALGLLDLTRQLARRGRLDAARGFATGAGFAILLAAAVLWLPTRTTALPALRVIVPGVAAIALFVAAAWPRRRIVQLAAPGLALALVSLAATRTAAALEARASFQRPEMLRARESFAKLVDRGSVIITTEDVGRPAENIDYYSGVAYALYLTDIDRWRLPVNEAAHLFLQAGMTPYLYLPASDPRLSQLLTDLDPRFRAELVADIPPQLAKDHFVAAAFHRGVRMMLYKISRRTPG
jgi:hypothetical protein